MDIKVSKTNNKPYFFIIDIFINCLIGWQICLLKGSRKSPKQKSRCSLSYWKGFMIPCGIGFPTELIPKGVLPPQKIRASKMDDQVRARQITPAYAKVLIAFSLAVHLPRKVWVMVGISVVGTKRDTQL